MFTGLVETTARVVALTHRGSEARLSVAVALEAAQLGESISVSGVCLTVTRADEHGFDADVSSETLRVTTLGEKRTGHTLNIERSLRLGDRLGGHLVLGHVDGIGIVRSVEAAGEARRVVIAAPSSLMRYFSAKGSVTVDGASLTINRLLLGERAAREPSAGDGRGDADAFELMLVPHTLSVTTLGVLAVGARVNLEVDVLARYVGRMLDAAGVLPRTDGDSSLYDKLKTAGIAT
ncbi:MAG: riboflavin synthase [Myxococcales bacterium]|nr:riboflavin synthase [Myxococcales bacterium]